MSWAETVKDTLKMQEVLERYLGSPDRMKKWLCPFHSDKHPSLSVNERTNKFKCFACGEGGDVIDFAEKFFKCSQREALLTLSDDFGLGLAVGRRENPRRTNKIVQQREFEREAEEELERRCKEQKKSIYLALWVARDVYYRNCPRKGENFNSFMETARPNRCGWAAVQEEYSLWLLDCLDCEPFDEYNAKFHFDLDILHKNPMDFAERGENSNWRLGKRKRKVLEMLEKGEIGYIWQYHNTMMSA